MGHGTYTLRGVARRSPKSVCTLYMYTYSVWWLNPGTCEELNCAVNTWAVHSVTTSIRVGDALWSDSSFFRGNQ